MSQIILLLLCFANTMLWYSLRDFDKKIGAIGEYSVSYLNKIILYSIFIVLFSAVVLNKVWISSLSPAIIIYLDFDNIKMFHLVLFLMNILFFFVFLIYRLTVRWRLEKIGLHEKRTLERI